MTTAAIPRDRLLRVEELARQLSVTEKWIYTAVAQGRLPVVRVGRQLRFDPADISTWIADHREVPR